MAKLVKHGRKWQVRLRVPQPLVALFGCDRLSAIFEGEEGQARLKAAVWEADLRAEFARLSLLSASERGEILSAGGLHQWRIAMGLAAQLPPLTEAESAGMSAEEIDAYYFRRFPSRAMQDIYAFEFFERTASSADEGTPLSSEQRRILEVGTVQAARELPKLREKVAKAAVIDAKIRGKQAPNGKANNGLDQLLDDWKRQKSGRSPKSMTHSKQTVETFKALVGDKPAAEITRDDVRLFRDRLEGQGATPTLIKKHLERLSAVFGVGLSEGRVEANPVTGVKVPGLNAAPKSPRKPFTAEQVRHILDALDEPAAKSKGPDFAWIVRLLVWHGCRSGEVCQLRLCDVLREGLDGGPTLNFNTEPGIEGIRRTLKNPTSARIIPLHPQCEGFLDYVAAVSKKQRRSPQAFVFQSLSHRRADGGAGGFQVEAGAKWLRLDPPHGLGFKDTALTVHSLRHRWVDAATATDPNESLIRLIVGKRAAGGSHGGYIHGHEIAAMRKLLASVDPTK